MLIPMMASIISSGPWLIHSPIPGVGHLVGQGPGGGVGVMDLVQLAQVQKIMRQPGMQHVSGAERTEVRGDARVPIGAVQRGQPQQGGLAGAQEGRQRGLELSLRIAVLRDPGRRVDAASG